jgi:Family of unknown function (DUF6152)
MNMTIRKTLLAAVALTIGAVASAHHSAVAFDFGKSVTYTGTVKLFRAVEPHLTVVMEIKDAKGTREVKFEGHSLNNLYRGGYRKGSVKVGDTLTVTAAPYRDGHEGGYVIGGQTQGGEYWGMKSRSASAADTKSTGDEVRKQAEGR